MKKVIGKFGLLVLVFLVFTSNGNAAINPSWPYCENHGGRGDIREDATRSQYSVCVFEDGSECDAFDFYYGNCSPDTGELVWKGSGVPDFADYSVKFDQSAPAAKDLQLDDELEFLFKTYGFTDRLKKSLKEKPNFAGNLILTSFGHCGTGCEDFVVIDRLTGRVSMPQMALFNGSKKYGDQSRLLILKGMLNEDENQVGTHYFVWSGGELVPLQVCSPAISDK